MVFSLQTILAISIYVVTWFFYLWLVDYSPWHKKTLSYLVAQKRIAWFKIIAKKEIRIMDGAMLSAQMNGSLFYASSSMLALGACFALLTNKEYIVDFLFTTLNQSVSSPIEIKIMALMCIFAYSFFKFGWSFRLCTYSAVLLGSIPEPLKKCKKCENKDCPKCVKIQQEIDSNSMQAAHINIQSARHFDRGQRAIFASLPLLSWFAGDNVMAIVSVITVLAMFRRQFLSQSVYILK